MAHQNHDPDRRRPGEDPIDWTIRTAKIRPAANGYWYIHYTAREPGDKAKYRTRTASTGAKDEASAWAALKPWAEDIRALANQAGQAAAPGMETFSEAARRYLEDTQPRRLSDGQDRAIKPLIEALGEEPLDQINHARIAAFDRAAQRQGRASNTIRHRLDVLLTVLRHAAMRGVISRDAVPRYRLPSIQRNRVYALDAAEDARVFETATRWALEPGRGHAKRTGLFVCLALDTAQRKEAILDLTWDRVDLRPGRAMINFVNPDYQPANKKRCGGVPVSRRLAPVLARAMLSAPRDARGQPTGLVFPKSFNFHGFVAFREAVGLPLMTPHVARHTWATLALARGVAIGTVSYILADSIATIDRTYNHHTHAMARENLDKYNQPVNDDEKGNKRVMASD